MAQDTGMPFSNLMGVEIVERGKDRVVGRPVVREDLCTAGGILHGGAFMAFADALGGDRRLPQSAGGGADDDPGVEDQLPGRGQGRLDRHRRGHATAHRPPLERLADPHHQRRGQAAGAGAADPDDGRGLTCRDVLGAGDVEHRIAAQVAAQVLKEQGVAAGAGQLPAVGGMGRDPHLRMVPEPGVGR